MLAPPPGDAYNFILKYVLRFSIPLYGLKESQLTSLQRHLLPPGSRQRLCCRGPYTPIPTPRVLPVGSALQRHSAHSYILPSE